ncbi:MAG: hypothetical protein P8X75_01475 [Limibacillus sp.]|jgi:hypothetical protein
MKFLLGLFAMSLLVFSLASAKGVQAAAQLGETPIASQASGLESGDSILERGKTDHRGRHGASKRGG